jgi:hypothetical protein
MSFRFRERIQIARGLAINLSKGWPSMSIGGHGSTTNVGRPGPRAALGSPGTGRTGLSWQLGGHRHVHKAVQAQAEIKAVHAQGTAKAVQAQAEIIAITKRMETVARRLTRNAVGSTYWKKAAFEQAQLLDQMLDVAKMSENDQLIAAVHKCRAAWGDGHPNYREALDSGLTITECLAMVLAGRQPDQSIFANRPNLVGTTTGNLNQPAVKESSAKWEKPEAEKRLAEFSIEEPAFWRIFSKTRRRVLVLPLIGCGVLVVAYTITARKATVRPPVTVSATPKPEPPTALPAPSIPAASAVSEPSAAATPAPQVVTTSVPATPTPSPHEPVIHSKAGRKKHAPRN